MVRARPYRPIGSTPGMMLALVALALQLAAAAMMPMRATTDGLDRLLASSICHSDDGTTDQGGTSHHVPGCALCPLCQAIAHAGIFLAAPAVGIASPVLVASYAFILPPARAPPHRVSSAASARGPPAAL